MTTRLETAHVIINGGDENEVSRILRRILTTKTGQAIDLKIRTHGWVSIIPNSDPEPLQGSTRPLGPMALIEFSPHAKDPKVYLFGEQWRYETIRRIYPSMGPDEILFHEMVHAARLLGGDVDPISLSGAMKPYENEEEYFAILVTNIYESEKGKTSNFFRRSHSPVGSALKEADAVSEVFLFRDDNYRLIEKFCQRHPTIAPMIAAAPAKFNPIRAYYESKEIKLNDDEKPGPLPIRITQHEERPPVTDSYLLSLLEPRYRADDVAGYGARERKLEEVFRTLRKIEAIPLFARLQLRRPGDKVAMYFHDHLATATRQKLLDIVRSRVSAL